MIALYWQSTSQAKQSVPSTALYHLLSSVPITGNSYMINAEDMPMAPTTLEQGIPSTFSKTALTIIDYKIEIYSSGSWAPSVTGNTALTGTVSSLSPGVSTQLRVTARNSLGYGVPSSSKTLIPAILPLAPASISVTTYGSDYLVLQWSVPTDTGTGGTSTALTNYKLQVDENFGSGFTDLTEQTSDTYTH